MVCLRFVATTAAQCEEVAATLRRYGGGYLTLRTDSHWLANTVRFVVSPKVLA